MKAKIPHKVFAIIFTLLTACFLTACFQAVTEPVFTEAEELVDQRSINVINVL